MDGFADLIVFESDWMTFVFLAIFLLITIAKFTFSEGLSQTASLFISKKYLLINFTKEKNNILNPFQGLLFCVQILTISVGLYLLNIHFNWVPGYVDFTGYLWVFVVVLSYFIIRFSLGFFIAFIFGIKSIHLKIMFEKINYLNTVVLWILPFLILSNYSVYSKEVILTITGVLGLAFLSLRYTLLILNNKKLVFSELFYFIMYLCALEIAPLIIFLKLTI